MTLFKIAGKFYRFQESRLVKASQNRPKRPEAKHFTGHQGHTNTSQKSIKEWNKYYKWLNKQMNKEGGLSRIGVPEEFHDDYKGNLSRGSMLTSVAQDPIKSEESFHHVQDHRGVTQAVAQKTGRTVRLLATAPWNLPHAKHPKNFIGQDKQYPVRGAGSAMMEHLVRHSMKEGDEGELELDPDESAVPFYKHIGFEYKNPDKGKEMRLSPENAQKFLEKREQSGKALKNMEKSASSVPSKWHDRLLDKEGNIINFVAHPEK